MQARPVLLLLCWVLLCHVQSSTGKQVTLSASELLALADSKGLIALNESVLYGIVTTANGSVVVNGTRAVIGAGATSSVLSFTNQGIKQQSNSRTTFTLGDGKLGHTLDILYNDARHCHKRICARLCFKLETVLSPCTQARGCYCRS